MSEAKYLSKEILHFVQNGSTALEPSLALELALELELELVALPYLSSRVSSSSRKNLKSIE